jgi:hypothetical protein
MKQLLLRPSVPVLAVLGFLSLSTPGWAYVPPAGFIVKNMAAKREISRGVRIRSSLTVFDSETGEQTRFKLSHIFTPANGVLRSILSDENGIPLFQGKIEGRGSSVTLNVPAESIAVLLLEPQWAQVVRVLRRQGLRVPSLALAEGSVQPLDGNPDFDAVAEPTVVKVPVQPSVFLSRWNKTIAWVVGDRKNGPQFWVEKDTFLPLRWVSKVELEFQNYRIFKDLPYPRVITLSENKKQLLKEELVELKEVPMAEKERKDLESGFTESGKALPASVRALVQRYFEFL